MPLSGIGEDRVPANIMERGNLQRGLPRNRQMQMTGRPIPAATGITAAAPAVTPSPGIGGPAPDPTVAPPADTSPTGLQGLEEREGVPQLIYDAVWGGGDKVGNLAKFNSRGTMRAMDYSHDPTTHAVTITDLIGVKRVMQPDQVANVLQQHYGIGLPPAASTGTAGIGQYPSGSSGQDKGVFVGGQKWKTGDATRGPADPNSMTAKVAAMSSADRADAFSLNADGSPKYPTLVHQLAMEAAGGPEQIIVPATATDGTMAPGGTIQPARDMTTARGIGDAMSRVTQTPEAQARGIQAQKDFMSPEKAKADLAAHQDAVAASTAQAIKNRGNTLQAKKDAELQRQIDLKAAAATATADGRIAVAETTTASNERRTDTTAGSRVKVAQIGADAKSQDVAARKFIANAHEENLKAMTTNKGVQALTLAAQEAASTLGLAVSKGEVPIQADGTPNPAYTRIYQDSLEKQAQAAQARGDQATAHDLRRAGLGVAFSVYDAETKAAALLPTEVDQRMARGEAYLKLQKAFQNVQEQANPTPVPPVPPEPEATASQAAPQKFPGPAEFAQEFTRQTGRQPTATEMERARGRYY